MVVIVAAAALVLGAMVPLGGAAPGKAEPTPPPAGSLQTYWAAFNTAFAAKDAAKVAAMTKFPLHVRGSLDGYPEFHINRARFLKFFPKVVEQEASEDGRAESLRSIVERTKTLTANEHDPSSARLSSLVFRFSEGSWKLEMIYSDVKP